MKTETSKIKLMKHYVQNTETGVKVRVRYSRSILVGNRDAVTIYAKDYLPHLSEVFGTCENNNDHMVDYFEKDRFRIFPDNPLWAAACGRADNKK